MATRSPTTTRTGSAAVVGIVLIAVGGVALLLRAWGIDPFERMAQAGWPLFVIVPGIVLLAVAFVVTPPRGVGFAMAGTIVTSVGALLWYQEQTGDFESWAYAWALVAPGAAGLGLAVYGLAIGDGGQLRAGLRLMGIALALFVIGAWYFGALFTTGRVPFDIDAALWWPLGLIVFGGLIVLGGLTRGTDRGTGTPPPHDA